MISPASTRGARGLSSANSIRASPGGSDPTGGANARRTLPALACTPSRLSDPKRPLALRDSTIQAFSTQSHMRCDAMLPSATAGEKE